MKALVLAGGFAKRMWPLTTEQPKSLLPLKGKPILEHVLRKIEPLEGIDQVFISVNRKFEPLFAGFLQHYRSSKLIRLVVEDSLEEEKKLGSVGAIMHFLLSEGVEEPLLVVAGDNVMDSGLFGMMMLYRKMKSPVVGLYNVPDRGLCRKYGIVELDSKGRIAGFEEKPEEPKSTLASTGLYILTATAVQKIPGYLESNPGDRMGDFIRWLSNEENVHGFIFQGKWFDVGSMEEYQRAERELD